MRKRFTLAWILLVNLILTSVQAQVVIGDSIADSLSGVPGDPVRGRAIVASRQTGLCLLCHSGPFPEERFQGNLAPDLSVSSKRLTVAQLRARIVNASRFNPGTIMPTYYKAEHLNRVGPKWIGQAILNEQEIEDVVAFLASLNDQP
jgi:L-cysteine S-thiosulfotransferase